VGETSGDMGEFMGGGGPVGSESQCSFIDVNPDCTMLAVVSIS
jgi:hypothetical protein